MQAIKRFRPSIYGILLHEGRVLVCDTRTDNGVVFNNFPGGGIELGEQPAAALLREFKDETGLVIRARRIVYASLAFHRGVVEPKQQLLGIYWQVEWLSGRVKTKGNGNDVTRVFWATPRELLALPFTTFDREVLPEIIALIQG